MFALIIGFSFAIALPVAAQGDAQQSNDTCTAERLRPFVSPTGIRQAWPTAMELPAQFASNAGIAISDQGNYQDGYSHWLYVDLASNTSYVVQRGGFSGGQTVFGPLPLANCASAL